MSEKIDLKDILERAEVLFYVFRDAFIKNAPDSLGKDVKKVLQIQELENLLAQISNIQQVYPLTESLDKVSAQNQDATKDEWLELIGLFQQNV